MHRIASELVSYADGRVPVSIKMRSGFEDTSLFVDNLLAIQAAGVSFITIHPRTRNQGYNGRADWSLIRKAKASLHIPVVRVSEAFFKIKYNIFWILKSQKYVFFL